VGGGRKSSSPIDKAHGLYNSLYYHTSRDLIIKLSFKVTGEFESLLLVLGSP